MDRSLIERTRIKMYSAIVLDKQSHNKLVEIFSPTWENNEDPNFEVINNLHMTICMGGLPVAMDDMLGQEFTMKVLAFAGNDKVKAVEVERVIETKNKVAHITLAVNRSNGGKPKDSNQLQSWVPVKQEIYITGILRVVE